MSQSDGARVPMSVLEFRQVWNIDDARYETIVELSDDAEPDVTFLHRDTAVSSKEKARIKKAGLSRTPKVKLAENRNRLSAHYANHHCIDGHNGHTCYMAKALISQIEALEKRVK